MPLEKITAVRVEEFETAPAGYSKVTRKRTGSHSIRFKTGWVKKGRSAPPLFELPPGEKIYIRQRGEPSPKAELVEAKLVFDGRQPYILFDNHRLRKISGGEKVEVELKARN